MAMKKIAFMMLFLMCCSAVVVAQEDNVRIKGKIVGIKKGRLYLIARSTEESSDTLGFCDFKKGKFDLKAAVDEPLVTQLVVEGFSGGFMLLAEPGTTYSACLSEGEDFYIKGGVLNERYTEHIKASDSLRAVADG